MNDIGGEASGTEPGGSPNCSGVSLSAVKRDQERGAAPGRAGANVVKLLGLQCRMVKESCVRCWHFQLAKDGDGGIGPKGGFCFKNKQKTRSVSS